MNKIYITTSATSSGEAAHLGLLIVQNGVNILIDGNQSEAFGLPLRIPLSVATKHNPIFGNIILETITSTGTPTQQSLDAFGAVGLNIDPADVDSKITTILNAISNFGSGTLYTHDGIPRTYYDLDIGYNPVAINSNSVANTLLSVAGIDMRDVVSSTGQEANDYVGHLHLLDSSGDDTFTAYQYDGIFDTTVFHDNTGNDTIIVEDGAQVRVLNDEDINGSNTLVLQGVIDQNNIFLTQHLDDLWIYTRADSGSEWNRVAILDDHFDFVLNSGSGTDTLQLSDLAGQIVGAFNIDQAILTPDQLGHIAPHSLFNTQYEITQLFFGQGITTTWDPLLIDLDGDGYEIKSRANSVYFDLDSDGYASSINWTEVNSDDGWLVRDVNGNGRIDNGSELFGSDVLDGFSDLAQYDGNADGIIDASDAIWSNLQVWIDTNGDAQTLTAELHTLDSLNIQSIDVGNAQSNPSPIHSSNITHTSTVTTTTGTLDIANLSLWTDTRNTVYAGDYTLDVATLFLPDVRGYSQLKSLRDALNVDTQADTTNGTTLLEKMEAIASYGLSDLFENYDTATHTLQEALFQWAGVVDVAPDSRGDFIEDARILEFFEVYYGEAFIDRNVTSTNPGAVQAQELEGLWDNKMNDFKAIVFGQLAGSQLYENPDYHYNWEGDHLDPDVGGTSFILSQSSLDGLSAQATLLTTVGEQELFWVGVVDYLRATGTGGIGSGLGYLNIATTEIVKLDVAIQASDPTNALDYASIEYRHQNPLGETFLGDAGGIATDDSITGTLEADTLIGKLGSDTLNGGDGDDVLYGYDPTGTVDDGSADLLLGMDGDDQLFGGNGVNVLWGGGGNDHLIGGNDNDILGDGNGAGAAQDLLEGGAGDDTYVQLDGAQRNDIFIVDSSGTDYLEAKLSYSNGAFQGFARYTLPQITFQRLGNDDLKILANGTNQLVTTINNQFSALNDLTGEGVEYLLVWSTHTSSGNPSWLNLKNHLLTTTDQIKTFGTNSDDVINGILTGNKDDNIRGYNGHDVINGDAGDDFIDGDDGDDILSGGVGNDTIQGGNGEDVIDGGEGDDELYGQLGNDEIYGGNGDDLIRGDSGNDTLYGDAGDDDIHSGGGIDVIYAGAGNDLITASGDSSHTTIFYESGIDTILTSSGYDELVISNISDLNDLIFVSKNDATTVGKKYDIYLNGVIDETLDHITVHEKNGVSGKGRLETLRVILTDGTEHVLDPAQDFTFVLSVTEGDDYITYQGLYGYDNFQVFDGLGGDDTIFGGGKHDRFTGGTGDDFINGNNGSDYFYYSNGDGHDTYIASSGNDIIFLDETIDFGALTFAQSGNDLDIIINAGTDYITLEDQFINSGFFVMERIGTLDNVFLYFNDYDQWTFGDNTDQTLIGQIDSGSAPTGYIADTIFGYDGVDIILGYSGNDILLGGNGADYLYGGIDNDVLYGGNDNDRLYGEDGNDTLYGEAGNDYIYGHLGNDILNGGADNDVLYGLEDVDTLDGGTGNDYLYGGTENDLLYGGEDHDKLYGEDGDDLLNGDAGTDVLYGGLGNDTLIGGTGTDFLYGQGGADVFALDNVSIDRLSDFNQSEGDTIHIADLLTGYDSATDDINDFVNLVIRNTGRTDIRINEDGQGNDLQYAGIIFSDLTAETVDSLVASGTLLVA